jgi:hypothetical protein
MALTAAITGLHLGDCLPMSAFGQTGHWSRHGGGPAFDPERTSIRCRRRRRRRRRHNHLHAISDAAGACARDLASGVVRHDVAPAFRTGISSGCRDEIILWTDIGTHHVMKHWINLQPFSPASRAHRLIPFQSASRAPRAHPRRRLQYCLKRRISQSATRADRPV